MLHASYRDVTCYLKQCRSEKYFADGGTTQINKPRER